jgi:type IX secretion system PorP/SprF family membrane protein
MVHTSIKTMSNKTNRLKIKGIFCCCLLFAGVSLRAQQEAMYSEYTYNMLNINPAYAGNRAGDNVTSLFRKQWVNIDGAPTTFSVSWDRGTEDDVDGLQKATSPVGYGVQLYCDRLGIETSQGIQGFYSYRLKFRDAFLSLGVSGGVLNYRASYSQVKTSQGGDPLFQEDVNAIMPTVGIGALFTTMHWYAGFSIPALLQTKITNDKAQVTKAANNHYFLTGGYIFDATEDLKLKPSVMFRAIKGQALSYDLNLNAWIQNTIGLGVSYRAGDALVGMFDIRVTPVFTVGYAYDYLISNLKTFSTGSHELMLKYEFNQPKNQRIISPRYY